MKIYKNAAVLLAIFVVLLAGYMAYQRFAPNNAEESGNQPTEKKDVLLAINQVDVSRIDIVNNGKTYAFEKKVDGYTLTSNPDLKTDQTVVDSIVRTLSNLKSERVISNNTNIAGGLEQFGLQKGSAATVSVVINNKPTKVLYIGDKTPSSDAYYARISDSNKVYTISLMDAEALLVDDEMLKKKEEENGNQ